jgi:Ca2+-binding RTX toxin-like protein
MSVNRIGSGGPSYPNPNDPIEIKGGSGNDKINVAPGHDGGVNVTVTDQYGKSSTQYYNAEEAARLVIKGGAGNDSITVDPRVKQGITIEGGKGNDYIRGGTDTTTSKVEKVMISLTVAAAMTAFQADAEMMPF